MTTKPNQSELSSGNFLDCLKAYYAASSLSVSAPSAKGANAARASKTIGKRKLSYGSSTMSSSGLANVSPTKT